METKCGCVYCTNRPELFTKNRKSRKANGRVYDPPTANHMDIYLRLSRIKIMHGHPGPPKPRKSG